MKSSEYNQHFEVNIDQESSEEYLLLVIVPGSITGMKYEQINLKKCFY